MNECNHEKRTAHIERTLYGDENHMGAIHKINAFGEALKQHVDGCTRAHEEKRKEDKWWYRLIIGIIVSAAVPAIIGLIAIGFKVWATKP